MTIIGYTSWCGLGFIRGINSYKYNHYKYEKKETYMYSSLILNGILGIFIYVNPILLPITLYKELYRLEINIRNIQNEKNQDYYNDLL
jgi:hypothetical protein